MNLWSVYRSYVPIGMLDSNASRKAETTGREQINTEIFDEFKRCLQTKDMYNMRSKAYWLRRLENYKRKETVQVSSYTIEHVMPQNPELSQTWQTELGANWQEVHDTYLHTLGNLTLTGYNSELSDKPFKEKQSMEGGFADSPLRLNKSLAKCSTWSEAAILDRAKEQS